MEIRKVLGKSRIVRRLYKFICIIRYQLGSRYMLKNGYVIKFKGIRSKFFLPLYRWDPIQERIFIHRNYYERDNLDFICKKWNNGIIEKTINGCCVLDIGANIGNHSLYFLNECGCKFLYAFEPAKQTFDILKKNVSINHLDNKIELLNVGVGSVAGKGCISFEKNKNLGETQIAISDRGDIEIIAIDDLDIPEKIGLVKIDTEGFEIEVLKGMINTLKRDTPFIMIELWEENYNAACQLLSCLGYKQIALDRKREVNADYLFYV